MAGKGGIGYRRCGPVGRAARQRKEGHCRGGGAAGIGSAQPEVAL